MMLIGLRIQRYSRVGVMIRRFGYGIYNRFVFSPPSRPHTVCTPVDLWREILMRFPFPGKTNPNLNRPPQLHLLHLLLPAREPPCLGLLRRSPSSMGRPHRDLSAHPPRPQRPHLRRPLQPRRNYDCILFPRRSNPNLGHCNRTMPQDTRRAR